MKTEIIANNGVCMIESIIAIAPELVQVLKDHNNKKRIVAMLKDLHLAHRLEEKENECVSVAGMQFSGRMDKQEIEKCEKLHIEFLEFLEKLQKEQQPAQDTTDQPHNEDDDEPTLEQLLECLPEFAFNSIFGPSAIGPNIIVVAVPKGLFTGKEE